MSAAKLHVDRYEKFFLWLAAAMLLVFVTAIGIAGFAIGIQVPQPEGRIDPRTVRSEGPFANPGVRELAPKRYEAYIRAEAKPWKFYPQELRIPAGSTVTFYVTSADVQHGFDVLGTNVNIMVVPGQISKVTHTFDTPREYPFVCTEFCGVGHQNMFGKIIVE